MKEKKWNLGETVQVKWKRKIKDEKRTVERLIKEQRERWGNEEN